MDNKLVNNIINTYIVPPYNILEEKDIMPLIKRIRQKVLTDNTAQKIYLAMSKDIAKNGTNSVFYPQLEEQGKEDFYLKQAEIVEKNSNVITKNLKKHGIESEAATTAPNYYRDYGNYYLKRFIEPQAGSAINPKTLSIPGILFRNNTLKALQESFVMLAKEDPALFQTMQYFKQDKLLEYAFDSHPIAYQKAGIHGISKGDHLTVFRIGNSKSELFTKKGFKQVAAVLSAHITKHINECFSGFIDTFNHSNKPTNHQHMKFVKKYVDNIINQDNNRNVKIQEVKRYLHKIITLASGKKPTQSKKTKTDRKLSRMINQTILNRSSRR